MWTQKGAEAAQLCYNQHPNQTSHRLGVFEIEANRLFEFANLVNI